MRKKGRNEKKREKRELENWKKKEKVSRARKGKGKLFKLVIGKALKLYETVCIPDIYF